MHVVWVFDFVNDPRFQFSKKLESKNHHLQVFDKNLNLKKHQFHIFQNSNNLCVCGEEFVKYIF
jgi:hypothetical protein